MRCIVFFSGGEMSWAAAKRAVARYGADNTRLLFTDTLIEDPDLYRFLREGAANVGAELVWIKEGRTPWQVFDDVKMLGNSRFDPCSRVLKREPAERWLAANCDPAETMLAFGIHASEADRFDGDPPKGKDRRTGVKNRYAALGWPHTWAPLMDPPHLSPSDIAEWVVREGMQRARMYLEGFSHNNCGRKCIKAGKGHYAHVLRVRPEDFAELEAREIAFNANRPGKKFQTIVQDVHTDRPNTPVSMTELRRRIEAKQVDLFDVGGCGCFTEDAT